MHFSKEAAINCFIISSSYVASRAVLNGSVPDTVSNYGACLNPAIALGITLSSTYT